MNTNWACIFCRDRPDEGLNDIPIRVLRDHGFAAVTELLEMVDDDQEKPTDVAVCDACCVARHLTCQNHLNELMQYRQEFGMWCCNICVKDNLLVGTRYFREIAFMKRFLLRIKGKCSVRNATLAAWKRWMRLDEMLVAETIYRAAGGDEESMAILSYVTTHGRPSVSEPSLE